MRKLAKQRTRELLAIARLLNAPPLCLKLNDADFLRKKHLNLCCDFGEEGMRLFCAALSCGALASLQQLRISSAKIGDEDMKVFSSVLSSGVIANLNTLQLSGNQISDAGMIALAG